MADQKISQLTELTNPNPNDIIPIVNGGSTKKITVANLAVAGSSGTSGSNGSSGTSGVNGTSGTSGTSGSSGLNGSSGTSGSNGSSGTSGVTGSSGTSGINGTNGSSGTSGTIAIPAWTSAGAVSISGTTTAPTKGTRTVDNISYRQIGSKEWEVVMTYFQTANTGAANGSGDYLFTLPNSISFDMTIPSQTQYQANVGAGSWYNATYVIPSGGGMITNGATGGKIFPVVYNSTQFRILAINDSAWVKWVGSGHFQLSDNPYVTIQLTFRFTST